jgi:hypothetical protein
MECPITVAIHAVENRSQQKVKVYQNTFYFHGNTHPTGLLFSE